MVDLAQVVSEGVLASLCFIATVAVILSVNKLLRRSRCFKLLCTTFLGFSLLHFLGLALALIYKTSEAPAEEVAHAGALLVIIQTVRWFLSVCLILIAVEMSHPSSFTLDTLTGSIAEAMSSTATSTRRSSAVDSTTVTTKSTELQLTTSSSQVCRITLAPAPPENAVNYTFARASSVSKQPPGSHHLQHYQSSSSSNCLASHHTATATAATATLTPSLITLTHQQPEAATFSLAEVATVHSLSANPAPVMRGSWAQEPPSKSQLTITIPPATAAVPSHNAQTQSSLPSHSQSRTGLGRPLAGPSAANTPTIGNNTVYTWRGPSSRATSNQATTPPSQASHAQVFTYNSAPKGVHSFANLTATRQALLRGQQQQQQQAAAPTLPSPIPHARRSLSLSMPKRSTLPQLDEESPRTHNSYLTPRRSFSPASPPLQLPADVGVLVRSHSTDTVSRERHYYHTPHQPQAYQQSPSQSSSQTPFQISAGDMEHSHAHGGSRESVASIQQLLDYSHDGVTVSAVPSSNETNEMLIEQMMLENRAAAATAFAHSRAQAATVASQQEHSHSPHLRRSQHTLHQQPAYPTQ